MAHDSRFAVFEQKKRLWAIGSVHGALDKLQAVHQAIAQRFMAGDAVLYLGNLLGHGPEVGETLNEALRFRRMVILQDGASLDDVVFLRGCQEEMLYKLRQIAFARDPEAVLLWMQQQGIDPTLTFYETSCADGIAAARQGMGAVSAWMNKLKAAMARHDGHQAYMDALKRAAFTSDKSLLFVSANVNPALSLDAQSDAFWWGAQNFKQMDRPFDGFNRTIRGYDHRHEGPYTNDHHMCLDGGCGVGGTVMAACFDHTGKAVDHVEA